MKNKIIALVVLIIVLSGFSLWKKSTMKGYSFEEIYAQVGSNIVSSPLMNFQKVQNLKEYDTTANSFDALFALSDVVAIVQPVSRKQDISIVNTTVEIKKSYKSNFQVGQQIELFEQYHLEHTTRNDADSKMLVSEGGYIPMNMDKEYLVFLKKSELYNKDQYGFVSILYGKYPYLTQAPKVLEIKITRDTQEELIIEDFNNYDLVFHNLESTSIDPKEVEKDNELIQSYNAYKDNYMLLLEDLINTSYTLKSSE